MEKKPLMCVIYFSSDMALMYNDRAVLENYHVSSVFKLMQDDKLNILSGLKKEEYR